MKNIVLSLVAVAICSVFYQNCSSPIQDLGNKTTGSERCKNPDSGGNIRITNSGNSYTFTIEDVAPADRVVWNILGNTYTTNGMVYTNTLDGTFQEIRVYATGYSNECGEDRVFSATGVLSNSSCSPSMEISLNPETVIVGNAVRVNLNAESSINTGSIRWKIGAQDYPEANNSSEFSYPATTVGTHEIRATAEFSCGASTVTKSISKNLVVNQSATGSAQLTSFEPKPLVASGSTVGEDIYKITRNAAKRLSLGIANLKPGTVPTGLTNATGTNCVSDKQCFNLDASVTSTGTSASPNCQYKDISILAIGTNDQTSKFNSFIWCYADYCHVGKVKTNAQQCCVVNKYLSNGSCVAVTTGNYSPAGNNEQLACTNKPANSSYSGPSSNGTNNCPWRCNSGYAQSGNTCIAFGNYRPTIATSGSNSACNAGNTSCTINVDVSYVANSNNAYVDLRYMNGTQLPGDPSLTIPSSSITNVALTGSFKYRFTFTTTNATAISKLKSNQLALHLVSPSNPVNYQWNEPFHKVKPPSTGGGGHLPPGGGCAIGNNCQTP